MELLQYWHIIRRHWWLPVALTLLAFLASAAVAFRGASAYRTDLRLAISTIPAVDRASELYYDPYYYANLDSEYLADDLSEVIMSEAFAADVSEDIGHAIDPTTIAGATRAKKTHRLIDVSILTSTPDQGQAIGNSIVRILNDKGHLARYMAALGNENTRVSTVNFPVVHRANSPLGIVSEVGLRTLVGLFIGLALAFIVDYVDRSIRTRAEAEEVLNLPVLGEIPRLSQTHRRGRAVRLPVVGEIPRLRGPAAT